MPEEIQILADDHGHTYNPGLPGGEEPYQPPYVEDGGKECKDKGYYISVCESGFVDPVLRQTIVEAAATLHDCQVCVTAAEVRAAIDALEDLLDLTDSEYSMSGGEQSNPGSSEYEDVTGWSEDSANSDYSSAGGTVTCGTGGSMSMSCGVGVRSSSGSSQCSVRLMRQNAGESDFSVVAGTETTEATSDSTTTVIGFNYNSEVSAGDQFKVQYKNDDPGNPHTIIAEDSFWNISISSNNVGTFSGTTITDNTDLKTALQELETAIEAGGGGGGAGYEDYEFFSSDEGNSNIGGTTLTLTVFSLPPLSLEELRKRVRVLRNGVEMRLMEDISSLLINQPVRVFSVTETTIELHSTAPLDAWDEIEIYFKE